MFPNRKTTSKLDVSNIMCVCVPIADTITPTGLWLFNKLMVLSNKLDFVLLQCPVYMQ